MTAILDYSLARLVTDDVYGRTSAGLHGIIPPGWTLDTTFNPSGVVNQTGDPGELRLANGLYVYALKSTDPNDNRRILAFRGTEDARDWLANFTDIGESQFTPAAKDIVNRWLAQQLVASNRVELVGHSLGGALVQWTVNDTNREQINVFARGLTGNQAYQVDPTLLHFTTFNAPGITLSPGGLQPGNTTTVVDGEHHVIAVDFALPTPGLQGDFVHLLGGRPVGGTIVAHRVDFNQFSTDGNIYDAHLINKPWWNAPVDPGHVAPFAIDFQKAQVVGQFVADMLGPSGQVNGAVDALKIGLVLGAGLTAGTAFQFGTQLSQLIQGVGADLQTLATRLLAPGTDGLQNGFSYLLDLAQSAGRNVATFTFDLSAAALTTWKAIAGLSSAVITVGIEQLGSFVANTAAGIGNAFIDLISQVPSTFDLGRSLSFTDLSPFTSAYAQALADRTLAPELRTALEQAQSLVQQAGQRVVVQQGIGVNPFLTPGFDPAAAPVATGTVREGGANVFTVYLPYAAGTGGQGIRLTLNGLGSNSVTVLSGGQELTPQNGMVTLVMPEGQQQLFFTLRASDVSSNTVVSLAAVLVNSAGTATHVEHQEATVSLVDHTIDYTNGLPVATVSNQSYTELDNDHNYIYTASGESTIATRGGYDQIFGGASGEFISGGKGRDRIEGGGGNDTILGGSYFLLQQEDPGADGNDVADGQGGDDTIEGDQGNDRLYGSAGSDRLFGDAGTLVYGSSGSAPGGDDLVDGGADNDFLWGDYGADILLGGTGDDVLVGDYVAHSLVSTAPPYLTPVVFDRSRAKDDFLDGGDGADTLFGDGGDDTLVGGAGEDMLFGDYGAGKFVAAGQFNPEDGDFTNIVGNDVIDGGADNDFLYGMGGDDDLSGGEGGDVIFGDFDGRIWTTATVFGNDVIDAGGGNDDVIGGSGQDSLFGGTGDDRLWGDDLQDLTATGDDVLDGGEGADILSGGRGDDRLVGGEGHDILLGTSDLDWNSADHDVLTGGAGDDRLYGMGGDDVLNGGEGTDILFGDDYYVDQLFPGPNVLRPELFFQGLVYSTASGNDVLDGGADDDFLAGGAGNDTLFGGIGNDFLYGDSGHYGIGGNDRLVGGLGNDVLDGGGGNDSYEFNVGDGIDTVSDSGQSNDTVLFGSGITSSSVTLVPDSGRIFVKVGAGSDGILLGVANDSFGSQTIEQFQFADGTSLTYADLIARGFDISGTGNADILFGTNLTNRFRGGPGNDTFFGGLSEDTYFFNSGDGIDLITDSSTPNGRNTVIFSPDITAAQVTLGLADDLDSGQANVLVVRPGNGADAVYLKNLDRNNVFGPHAVDSFQFADGSSLSYQQLLSRGFDLVGSADSDMVLGTNITDRITAGAGNDEVRAGAGDDLLDGGAGDDQLRGESGNDTYVFGSGSGHDRILDEQGTADTVQLAPGILSSDVALTRSGDDLVVTLNGGADQLTIAHQFLLPKFRVEEIQFSDGSVLTSAFLNDPVIQGTQQSDILQGTSGDDVLVGLGGNDQIAGLAGQDTLDGGTGADQLAGGSGNDTYMVENAGDAVTEFANEGTDTVQSSMSYTLGSNVEHLTLTGNSTINGTGNELDNLLVGNSAANVLTGGLGDDTYVVGSGDRVIELSGEGDDTVMSDVSTTLGSNLENLTIAGSRSLTGSGNDLDNVMSAPGSISLLAGGLGNDTYVVGPSDDLDIIVEASGGGVDTVRASRNYRLPDYVEQLELIDPLLINVSVADPLQGLLLPGMTPTDSQGNPTGPNGTGNSQANTLIGTSQNNILDGGTETDTMIGGAGDDTYLVDNAGDVVVEQANEGTDSVLSVASHHLSVNVENLWLTGTGAINGTGNASANTIIGNDSANVLDGGAGYDFLQGFGGADTYLFGRGSGQDTVFDLSVAGEVDTVQFASDVAPTEVTVYQDPGNLFLVINGTTDELTLASFFGPTEYAQKQVRFADNTVWNEAELRARAVDGVPPTGTAGNNPPSGVAGGGDIGTVQSSLDYTVGPNERNLILSESGSSVLLNAVSGTGNALNNIIIGNTGDNILDGGSGDDVLIGGLFLIEPDNHLVGDNGSDILIGGAGDDTLIPFVPDARGFGDLALNGNNFSDRSRSEEFPNTPDDLLIGGQGNDTYVLFNAAETLFESAGEGVDTVRSTVDYTLGDNLENLTMLEKFVTTSWAIQGVGNDLDNVLVGNVSGNILRGEGGDDTLSGGPSVSTSSFNPAEEPVNPGNDLLIGGAGNDTYLFNRGDGFDTIQDASVLGAGNRIQFGADITRTDLTFTQNQTARTLTIQAGSSGTDQLILTDFDPTNANGSLVAETLVFADGSTASLATLLGRPVNHTPTVATPLADQTLPEDAPFSVVLPANMFADEDSGDMLTLSTSLADGTALPAWLTFDAMTGTYIGTPDDAQVGTVDLKVTATDTGNLSVSDVFTLTVTNVNEAPMVAVPLADQTTLEDTAFSFTVPAPTFVDVDQVHGDTLMYSASLQGGGSLPAWLSVDPLTHTFSGTPLNSDVGMLDITVTATDQGNLSASTGFTLAIQNVNDAPTVAVPIADQTAAEDSAFTLTVPVTTFTDVELTHGDVLTCSATLDDGNPLPAWLSFNSITRTFSGTPGAGDGGTLQIAVIGTDTGNLNATDTFALVISGPRPLTLVGTAGNDVLTGGRGDDTLSGLAGNDTLQGGQGHDLLDGGTGTDTMQGGIGNDIYIVDVSGDVVTELVGEGTDTVQSSIPYTLGANVENLTLTGTANLNGTGNVMNNILTGNGGTNVLTGGAGNDTYMVGAGDTVVEHAGGGTDTVQSSVAWTLSLNVENLTLTGTANINGTGSSANNVLIGNSGNNTLDSGSGNDAVDGGDGNDSLLGGSGNDTLLGGLGTDTLNAGSGNDVLNGGDGTDTLDGGSGDDQLLGGAGNDALTGGSGADLVTGGAGNDQLTGGSGNDSYNFSRGDGQDTVIDADPFPWNQDRALFGETINPLDLVISRQANDLRLAIHGSSDQITVQNWYLSTNNRIETIKAGNGQTLLNTQVDQLIQAMAGFTQQTGLTWDQAIDQQPQDVQAVLAASWQ